MEEIFQVNVLLCYCDAEDPSLEIFLYADDSKLYKIIRDNYDQEKNYSQ